MLLSHFQKAHIDKGLEQDLAFHFVDSHRELNCEALIAKDFDHLCLVLQLFTFIFDFGDHGESRGNLGLHSIENFEIRIFGLEDSDSGCAVGEVANLNSNFIVLIEFNIFEYDDRGDDF